MDNHLDIKYCLHKEKSGSSCCGEYNYINEEMFEEEKEKERNRVHEVNLQSGVLLQVYFSSLLIDLKPIGLCDVRNLEEGES